MRDITPEQRIMELESLLAERTSTCYHLRHTTEVMLQIMLIALVVTLCVAWYACS